MSNLKENILELRNQGLSYKQISIKLNCSKGSVSYYIGEGQCEKSKLRVKRMRARVHPFYSKIRHFLQKTKESINIISKLTFRRSIYDKLITFHFNKKGKYSMKDTNFTVEEVIAKIGENPVCYLTGESIDVNKPKTYQFDHIIPRSKGGSNTLDNLGICTRKANMSKTDMTKDEYIEHCKKVLLHNGYSVEKEQ